jgi:hypothetical protein
MDTPDSRFYIATDHLGSPIAVFDYKGKLVKEISRCQIPFFVTINLAI